MGILKWTSARMRMKEQLSKRSLNFVSYRGEGRYCQGGGVTYEDGGIEFRCTCSCLGCGKIKRV